LCKAGGVAVINLVSKVPSSIWEREKPVDAEHIFLHTREPVSADYHVVYGIRDALELPNSPERLIFVASEPPEIREYNLDILRNYGLIVGPSFPRVSALPHFRHVTGIAPWWLGVRSPTDNHYETHEGETALTRERLAALPQPAEDKLSVIMSTKARTPDQVQRIRLVEYLASKFSDLAIFGVGHNPVEDKAAVLTQFRYHLAVENSSHPGYWTEKLADPILTGCFTFYGGHRSYAEDFPGNGIQLIDPYQPEKVYRAISQAMETGAWEKAAEDRNRHKESVLSEHSFHRKISAIITSLPPTHSRQSISRIKAHHPESRWKKLVDPLYRQVARRIP